MSATGTASVLDLCVKGYDLTSQHQLLPGARCVRVPRSACGAGSRLLLCVLFGRLGRCPFAMNSNCYLIMCVAFWVLSCARHMNSPFLMWLQQDLLASPIGQVYNNRREWQAGGGCFSSGQAHTGGPRKAAVLAGSTAIWRFTLSWTPAEGQLRINTRTCTP